jgi:rubrerythrin
MKYQEALDRIKSERLWDDGLGDYYNVFDRNNKDIALLHELVDKATPKKPDRYIFLKRNSDGLPTHGFCKECGTSVLSKNNYCPNCGQAIDWSTDE